jgi:MoaA/NifB/PqqE/SkfB family radical SAM enzyme
VAIRCLNTNGQLVTPEIAERLERLVDEIRVSVDGPRARNDALRGDGSFDAALKALGILRAAGFDPIATVTVTRPGLADLERLIALLLDQRITRIRLTPFRAIGRGAAHPDWEVTLEEARETLARAWSRLLPCAAAASEPSPAEQSLNCGVGSFVNILPEGDVYPCHVLVGAQFRLGNVRQQRLSALCAAAGPLGRLRRLDFRALARSDPTWAPLTRCGACLGQVVARADAPALPLPAA